MYVIPKSLNRSNSGIPFVLHNSGSVRFQIFRTCLIREFSDLFSSRVFGYVRFLITCVRYWDDLTCFPPYHRGMEGNLGPGSVCGAARRFPYHEYCLCFTHTGISPGTPTRRVINNLQIFWSNVGFDLGRKVSSAGQGCFVVLCLCCACTGVESACLSWKSVVLESLRKLCCIFFFSFWTRNAIRSMYCRRFCVKGCGGGDMLMTSAVWSLGRDVLILHVVCLVLLCFMRCGHFIVIFINIVWFVLYL